MTIPIHIDQRVPAYDSYRAARVKSLFNATDEQATRFLLDVELPIDIDGDWEIGVIVGPSGSGKSSIGHALWGGEAFYEPTGWPDDAPIVDAIATTGTFDAVTAALAAAGLGDVPVWLRPYRVLSTGQKFRADLARVLAEQKPAVVFDEFTSVVDRQIAQVGAGAFAKAWRRTGGKAVLLSCHYDILDWVEPDWVLDTATKTFHTNVGREGERRWTRPRIDLEIRVGGWELWPLFKPHHYLDLPRMVASTCYAGFVNGEPVAHLAVATQVFRGKKDGRVVTAVEARASRLVVMPEWQGAGIGVRFLNHIAQKQLDGVGVLEGRRMTTQFQTSHPQLANALRRSSLWRQVSGRLHGVNKAASAKSMRRSQGPGGVGAGYGGHLRAVQGFRYYGEGK